MLKPNILRSSLNAVALVTIVASAAAAQSPVQRLDSLAGPMLERRGLVIVPAVAEGERTLLIEGYGKAKVEWDIPMPVNALFGLGSATSGSLLSQTSYAEMITPARLDRGAPLWSGAGIRDALKMGLIGAAGGAVVGVLAGMIVDPDGSMDEMWVAVGGYPGFLAGVVFSVVR